MSKKQPPANPSLYAQMLENGQISTGILLAERDMMLDLYKHHIKLLLEANVFIYAVTGALVSFVVTHTNIPHIRFILLLPAIVCAGFAFLFAYVTLEIGNTKDELGKISTALRTDTYPAIDALPIGLWVSAAALIVILLLLIAGMIWLSIDTTSAIHPNPPVCPCFFPPAIVASPRFA